MTIRIHTPEGRTGTSPVALAATPSVLSGQRVLVLDNGKPGALLLMERAAATFASRTGAEYVGARRKRTAATPCEEALFDEIVRDADLVLTGTAD
jgi:hypothetical protein